MAAAPGAVTAVVCCGGERLLEVNLPSTDRASNNIAKLKKETMAFMTDFLKQKNMDTDEVDLMEEVVSDGEEEGKQKGGKGQKGKKRKQQDAAKS